MGWREGLTPERPRSMQLKVLRIVTDTDGNTTKNCLQGLRLGACLRRYGFAGVWGSRFIKAAGGNDASEACLMANKE